MEWQKGEKIILKIRIQGTTNDIKWFLKMMKRNSGFIMNTPSDPLNIKGSNRYKRVYTEIYRDEEEFERQKEEIIPERQNRYYGPGRVLSSVRN